MVRKQLMTHKQLPRIVSHPHVEVSYVSIRHPSTETGESGEAPRLSFKLWIDTLEGLCGPLFGMSVAMQEELTSARFIPTAKAIASVEHLWATGLALWHDPLLKGFDTLVREHLSEVAEAAFDAGFYLLTDYLYDRERKYYAPRKEKIRIYALANYAFWANKTGSGLLLERTGLERYVQRPPARIVDGCPGIETSFAQVCQELYDELQANEAACEEMHPTADSDGP